jgi:hypothetical protein
MTLARRIMALEEYRSTNGACLPHERLNVEQDPGAKLTSWGADSY